jgi:NAD(P)-dependent dehydrogenase (short-subunit alcohol dehydrogenase family)
MRTALVIGGTNGIGAATAYRLATDNPQPGATDVAAARRGGADAETPADGVGGLGGSEGWRVIAAGLDPGGAPAELRGVVELRELDVRDPVGIEELVGSLRRLDVLVYAAGVIRRGDEHRPEVFRDVLDINLTGTHRAAEAAYGLLAESNGCVVNVASMLSFFGGPLVPGYSASKGGIVQLTKSLAVAWAPDGIRVNAVAPGWIATDLTAALRADPEASDRILGRTPRGRWGTPADVAGAIAFLTGPDAAFITGVVLPVDGGYLSA